MVDMPLYCNVIMAVDSKYGVGKDNDLPWPKNKEDLKMFKELTSGKIVVMGRKTWESLGSKKLPNRKNVVITSQVLEGPDLIVSGDVVDMLGMILTVYPEHTSDDIFLIGGAGLVENAHDRKMIKTFYLTCIEGIYSCDVFLSKEIFKDYEVKSRTVLREDTPKTTLIQYEKGIIEHAAIQRYVEPYT